MTPCIAAHHNILKNNIKHRNSQSGWKGKWKKKKTLPLWKKESHEKKSKKIKFQTCKDMSDELQ